MSTRFLPGDDMAPIGKTWRDGTVHTKQCPPASPAGVRLASGTGSSLRYRKMPTPEDLLSGRYTS